MANLIQIKRSLTSDAPGSLANGELAFTANGDVLYIGSNSTVVAIGGVRNPGVLTANHALIANSTGYLDVIKTANLLTTGVYANGSLGSAGQALLSNGTGVYWGTGTAGSNTQVQFNDSGVSNGVSTFTFDKVDQALYVGNAVSTHYITATNSARNITTNYNSESGTVGLQSNLYIGIAGGGNILAGQTANNQLVNLSNTIYEIRGGWNANNGALNLLGGSYTDSNYAKINLQGNTKTVTIEADATVAKTIGGSTLTTTNSTTFTVASGLVISGNGASITSVDAAKVGGNTASDLRSYSDTQAGSAYSNAMADTLSRSGSYTGNNTFGGTNTVFSSNVTISGTINRDPVITLSGDLTGSVTLTNLANGTLTATIAADSVALGTDTTGNYVATITAGNGISGSVSSEGSTPTIAVVANNGIVANTSGLFVDAGTGVTVNATGVHIGQAVGTTDNVTFNDIVINGNTVIGNTSADIVTVNGRLASDILPNANVTYSLGNNTLRFLEVHAQNTHSEFLYVDKDVDISGNLTVSGSLVTINVSTLAVTDSLIQLASNNNISDTLDIGFFGNYQVSGGAHEHTGLFRDASTDTYKLFKGLQDAPTTVVDVNGTGYTQATLESYLSSGGLVSNSTAVTLTANSTVAVNLTANSLTLSSPLDGASGGTGLASYTAEDILVANSSNGFRKLAVGSEGYVLQIASGVVAYGTLDGGTF